jgi:hypothetical protein
MSRARPLLIILPVLLAREIAAAPAPSVTGVFPAGLARGAGITAALSGGDLADVRAVLISGSGVTVEPQKGDAKRLPLTLTAASDAAIGPRELRVVTSGGVSNPIRVWVGRYPGVLEKEPNDSPGSSQVMETFPGTIDGEAGKAEDADCFRFRAAVGETWVFALNAVGHRSKLDGYLSLYDAGGRLVRSAMDSFDRDPRLVHTFKKAGAYTVQVRDSLYRGGPGFTYRLSLGKLPLVTRYAPLGGKPGATVDLELHGVNLGGTRTMHLALPQELGGRIQVLPLTAAGPAQPIELAASSIPELIEQEPNEAAAGARPLQIPSAVTGCIERSQDRDVFSFRAAEKQVTAIRVQARPFGSRLDAVLRVLNAEGKELASNDDAVGRDPRLSFTAPAAGDYFVEVRSLTGRGGEEYFYRLELQPPSGADFGLTLTPDSPTVPPGAATVLTVSSRRTGYNGPIKLRVEGLPPGVIASAAEIPQGQNSAVLTLSAPAGAQPAHSALKVVGTATIDGKNVEHSAEGVESYQPPLTNQPQQQRLRPTELTVAAVGAEPPYLFSLPPKLEIKAGQKLEVPVTVTRKAGFAENVAITVLGLPGTVKATALTVAGKQGEGKLTLTADAKAPVGTLRVILQGNGKNVLVALPTIDLVVLAP